MNDIKISLNGKNTIIQRNNFTIEINENEVLNNEKIPVENIKTDFSTNLNDVSAYSPIFMTFEEKNITFIKKRWQEVIHKIIELCSISKKEFVEKIPVVAKRILPKYNVKAVFGELTDVVFIKPERNGWYYIPEIDISIRIQTSNNMMEMIKNLIKKTKYEGKICLFLQNNYNENNYRSIPI